MAWSSSWNDNKVAKPAPPQTKDELELIDQVKEDFKHGMAWEANRAFKVLSMITSSPMAIPTINISGTMI